MASEGGKDGNMSNALSFFGAPSNNLFTPTTVSHTHFQVDDPFLHPHRPPHQMLSPLPTSSALLIPDNQTPPPFMHNENDAVDLYTQLMRRNIPIKKDVVITNDLSHALPSVWQSTNNSLFYPSQTLISPTYDKIPCIKQELPFIQSSAQHLFATNDNTSIMPMPMRNKNASILLQENLWNEYENNETYERQDDVKKRAFSDIKGKGKAKCDNEEPANPKKRTCTSPTISKSLCANLKKANATKAIKELRQIVSPYQNDGTAKILVKTGNYVKLLEDQLTMLLDAYIKHSSGKGVMKPADIQDYGLCVIPRSLYKQLDQQEYNPAALASLPALESNFTSHF